MVDPKKIEQARKLIQKRLDEIHDDRMSRWFPEETDEKVLKQVAALLREEP